VSAHKVRRRPEYFRLLAGILASYALIIILGDTSTGAAFRVALLAYLLWSSSRLHANRQLRRFALIMGIAAVVLTVVMAILFSVHVVTAVVGACSMVLIGIAIGSIASTLLGRWQVDTSTVLGVLCIYLLFALFFGGVHQLFAAFTTPYVNGVTGIPTSSDLLYFSVITLTTVGFGDITPASEVARAVTVVEAFTGQLYLVSVVAGVVSGWRAAGRDHST
jgi:voltage-gated potassium channel